MSVNIYLADPTTAITTLSAPALQLDKDGDCWALAPCIGRQSSLGSQSVDLYHDTVFAGASLIRLRAALASARLAYASGPPILAVDTGTRLTPGRPALSITIAGAAVVRLIDNLNHLARTAEASHQRLDFCGD